MSVKENMKWEGFQRHIAICSQKYRKEQRGQAEAKKAQNAPAGILVSRICHSTL